SCVVSMCNAGFADCDGKPGNGCEVALNTVSNCGSCGAVCQYANAVGSCATQQCQLVGGNARRGNCGMNPSNGCEKALLSDVNNCGACGMKCAQGQSCCSGKCLDVSADPLNCGACANVCGNGFKCLLGSCCASSFLNCGYGCVNPNTDNG